LLLRRDAVRSRVAIKRQFPLQSQDTVRCRDVLQRDSVAWPVVCDEMMFDGALVRQLGLLSVPDNIVLRRGRVVARGLQPQELINRLKTML